MFVDLQEVRGLVAALCYLRSEARLCYSQKEIRNYRLPPSCSGLL